MKLGLIISAVILLLFGLITFFVVIGVADSPTSASSPAKLAAAELPALGQLWVSDGSGECNSHYKGAFQYFNQHKRELNSDEPTPAKADELVGRFIAAMRAPDVGRPFLDDLLPVRAAGSSDLSDAASLAPQVVLIRAEQLWKKGDQDRAVQAAKSAWAFGQRALTRSVRFDNRYVGLSTMLMAAGSLAQFDPQYIGQLQPIVEPLSKIQKRWQDKIQVIRSPTPRSADLVNFARNDQDLTFRVEATLWLGPAKFKPGSKPNKRMILSAIEDAKENSEPLLAEAGRYADKLTIEEMRKIR